MATEMFEKVALLMHPESYVVLSSIIYANISFKHAVQGERIDCRLAHCYIHGRGVIKDVVKGFTLANESAKTGSCYG